MTRRIGLFVAMLVAVLLACGVAYALHTTSSPTTVVEASAPKRHEADEVNSLMLYYRTGCPFCAKVFRQLDQLNMTVPTRDLMDDTHAARELVAGGGKMQVPCLRIEDKQGHVTWLYESDEINRYLVDFAASRAAQ